jgi:hypothetical protein
MGKKDKKKKKHKVIMGEAHEDVKVVAQRRAFPDKKFESVPRADYPSTPGSAIDTLAQLMRDVAAGKDTRNARDEYILSQARRRIPYTHIAQQLDMPVDEVQRIHNEQLRLEYNASPEEVKLALIDQMHALMERLWAMTEQGVDKSTGALLLQSIKTLADLHGLMEKQTKVTVNVVTEHQATIFVAALQVGLEKVLSDPRIVEALPPADQKVLLAQGTREAAKLISDGQHQTIEVDSV